MFYLWFILFTLSSQRSTIKNIYSRLYGPIQTSVLETNIARSRMLKFRNDKGTSLGRCTIIMVLALLTRGLLIHMIEIQF